MKPKVILLALLAYAAVAYLSAAKKVGEGQIVFKGNAKRWLGNLAREPLRLVGILPRVDGYTPFGFPYIMDGTSKRALNLADYEADETMELATPLASIPG